MDRTKLIAFLLLVASLGAMLLACFMAAAPFLLPGTAQFTGDVVPPGCVAAAMFFVFGSLAVVPGIAGLALWLRTVRKRDRERAREAASWPDQESALQVCYDRLALALLSGREEGQLSRFQPGAEDFGPERRIRWRRFLVATGAPRELLLVNKGTQSAAPVTVSPRGLRIFAFVLFLLGAFCLAWAMLVVLVQMGTQMNRMMGFEVASLVSALFGAGGCLIPGGTATVGSLGLVWFLRQERRRGAAEEECKERAREILHGACVRRLERLFDDGADVPSPVAEIAWKLSRASVFDALAELDGDRKGRLLLALHGRGLTPDLHLQGADLREAQLANADLSGACLLGADLSGAVLTGARLERADLRGCRLRSVDLRGAFMTHADLRQGDLRDAWLHRCDLRNADLRNTDLRGALFWQTSLTDADLRDSFVSLQQLAATGPFHAGSPPLPLGGGQEGQP